MYHSIDICQDIAEKLKSPESISRSFESPFMFKTLGYGAPGIACFYAAMDHAFPNDKWDFVAHKYLQIALNSFKDYGAKDHSLFTGLTGLCFATHLCSRGHSRYQNCLVKLHDVLTEEVKTTLLTLKHQAVEGGVDNLTGVIAYLLLRKDEGNLQQLAKECIEALINYLIRNENQEVEVGILPILSIAYRCRIEVHGQEELMRRICSGFMGKSNDLIRVASGIYLAGLALNDEQLKTFGAEAAAMLFSKPLKKWNGIGPTFSQGKAGFLSFAQQMSKNTKQPLFAPIVLELENDLKQSYHPNHPYGFQSVSLPGILDGAAGIALILLSLDGRIDQLEWERMFLLR